MKKHCIFSTSISFSALIIFGQIPNSYRSKQIGYTYNVSTWEWHTDLSFTNSSKPPVYGSAKWVAVFHSHNSTESTDIHNRQTVIGGYIISLCSEELNMCNDGATYLALFWGSRTTHQGLIETF